VLRESNDPVGSVFTYFDFLRFEITTPLLAIPSQQFTRSISMFIGVTTRLAALRVLTLIGCEIGDFFFERLTVTMERWYNQG